MSRLYVYCFCFGRVYLCRTADTNFENKPYLRTREQAAGLIRLGAKLTKVQVVTL